MGSLNDRQLKWFAWSIAAAAFLLVATSSIFVYLDPGPQFAYWGSGLGFGVSYPLMGAIIVTRLPRHRMGWLFCSTAIWALDAFAGAYGAYALAEKQILPFGIWAAWLSRWVWLPGAFCIMLIALLFPSGLPLSRRWSLVNWLGAVGALLFCLGVALFPGHAAFPDIGISFDNPIGLAGADRFLAALSNIGRFVFTVQIPAVVISLVLRLRRSRGLERQQLKWFVFAAAVSLSVIPLAGPLQITSSLFGVVVVGSVVSALMPVAAGLAILRYRLYDVDLIIRRTLIYGILTAALALVYYSTVVLFEQFSHVVTGQRQSDVVIVLSTLTIAALFAPLRRRIRELIDRRFYRHKYDAAQVLSGFAATVRDEVDLNQLTQDLLLVVEEAMQPSQCSLWLRETQPRRKK